MSIPPSLRRQLRFGDPEQIAALKQWQAAIKDEESATGQLVTWDVIYTVRKAGTVSAINSEAAIQAIYDIEPEMEDIISIERTISGERHAP